MAIQKLPITGDAYKNIEQIGLTRTSPRLFDGYVTEPPENEDRSITVKRPGLTEFSDLGTGKPVDGLYWWTRAGVIIATSGNSVFSVDEAGTETDITGDALSGLGRPAFTDNGDTLIIADTGLRLLSYVVGGSTMFIPGVNVPADITHLGYLDGYILATGDESDNFYWSDLDEPLVWSAISFGAAEGSPDFIRAMNIAWREIVLIGDKTVEVWYNDGSGPFARREGSYTERGIGARHTLIAADNTWFWLDNFRRVVRLDGPTPKIVSTPFDKVLANMTRIDDAFSTLLEVDGRNFILFTFPTAKQTFVYDYARRRWAEWSYWEPTLSERTRYRGNSGAYAEPWGKWLVGDMANGKVYHVDPAAYDDDGDLIRFERRTGHISHDMLKRKRSNELTIQVKRGTGNSTVTDPQLMLKWRNENGSWSNEHWTSLGKVGDNEFIARFHRLGIYRSRQYSIVHTDPSPLALVSAEEDVEALMT